MTLPSAAISCIQDTLQLLIEQAQEAKKLASSKKDKGEQNFEAGRAEALIEALHTWENQFKTFGLEKELGTVGKELRHFLKAEGL
ncbi:hypothetical protein HYR99_38290 [Candidatus Poribacteria bacterium]|nr:hypothetical protein [Candidatus Poribacteria bacterium]